MRTTAQVHIAGIWLQGSNISFLRGEGKTKTIPSLLFCLNRVCTCHYYMLNPKHSLLTLSNTPGDGRVRSAPPLDNCNYYTRKSNSRRSGLSKLTNLSRPQFMHDKFLFQLHASWYFIASHLFYVPVRLLYWPPAVMRTSFVLLFFIFCHKQAPKQFPAHLPRDIDVQVFKLSLVS